jgi:hypothetical protein
MQCLEIYTGEAYTLPINFTYGNGSPANALSPNAWTLGASAKFYTVDNVTYPSPDEVVLGNINLNVTQPNANAYTLQTAFTNAAAGTAYLYIGNNITNSGNNTPNIALANSAANSTLVIVTLEVTKESAANGSLDDINREPLGFIVRYQ